MAPATQRRDKTHAVALSDPRLWSRAYQILIPRGQCMASRAASSAFNACWFGRTRKKQH